MDSSLENAPRIIDGRLMCKIEVCLVRDPTYFNHYAPRARKSKTTTTKEKYEEYGESGVSKKWKYSDVKALIAFLR